MPPVSRSASLWIASAAEDGETTSRKTFREFSLYVHQGLAENLRKVREQYRANIKSAKTKGSTDFYIVVVFRNYEELKAFLVKHSWDENRYHSGQRLSELLDAAEPATV